MRRTDNKLKSAKQASKKRPPQTIQLSTPEAAKRIFQLLNDQSQPKEVRDYLDEYVGELFSNTGATCPDTLAEFKHAFLKATRAVEQGKVRDIIDEFAKRDYQFMQDTLTRLDAGESLESIYKEKKAKDARRHKKQTSEGTNEKAAQFSKFNELMDADDSPQSVRAFIRALAAGLTVRAGMDGPEYAQDDIAVTMFDASRHIGQDAFDVAVNVAIETLTEYAPAASVDKDLLGFADYIIAALDHPNIADQTKEALSAIIVNNLSNSAGSWMTPEVLRVYLPFMLSTVSRGYSLGMIDAMHTIIDAQADSKTIDELNGIRYGKGRVRAPRREEGSASDEK